MALELSVDRAIPVKSIGLMSKPHQLILIHPDAPPKPMPGVACNGCGVCCLVAPCPLGMLLSSRRHGACVAVRWHDDLHQYRCAALREPLDLLQNVLPPSLRPLAPWLSSGLARLAKRWIAVGIGCDSSVEPAHPNGPAGTPVTSTTIRSGAPSGRS